ncbi:MAG: feruloyl-CoA synthase [Pararhodobacter sp.]|nr:feruloyl-CoA synthase [Pararhodobacter sp.]
MQNLSQPRGEAHEDQPTGGIFAPPRVTRTEGPDGSILLTSAIPMGTPARCVGDWLEDAAANWPQRVFMAERDGTDGWCRMNYATFLARARQIGDWLLGIGGSADRPVAVLSENALDHALLVFGAMHAGVPAASISPAYSLMSQDHAKLKAMVDLLNPSVILVSDPAAYGPALTALDGRHKAIVLASKPGSGVTPFADIQGDADSARLNAAFAAVTPDTVAKLLFTSGSTGTPKAVINTQRMLTASQEAHLAVCPLLASEPPVLVDWLPWSHTFGANFTTNTVLRNGGTLYIDDGKPMPGLIERTVRNIKEIRPTACFNVPRGFELLLQVLEEDAEFRAVFFNLRYMFYAAAALPEGAWARLRALSIDTTGRAMPMVSAWGSTETAPLATYCHFQAERSGNIGVPVPGVTLKLVPAGGKLEVRVKGPNVTPGYFRQPELSEQAFDAAGFYRIGDAVRLADPDDPARGLFFDGRVSEDFKLTSGTWVSVGTLRLAGIDALAPVAQDIVVAGQDRSAVSFLIFPNEAACRRLAGAGTDTPLAQVLAHPAIRAHVAQGLAQLKRLGGGASRHAARARLLADPPNPDKGEITDKAYINQRQVLANRTADLAVLYGDDPDGFISPTPEKKG